MHFATMLSRNILSHLATILISIIKIKVSDNYCHAPPIVYESFLTFFR